MSQEKQHAFYTKNKLMHRYIAVDTDFFFEDFTADSMKDLIDTIEDFIKFDKDEFEQFQSIEFEDNMISVKSRLEYHFAVYKLLD